MIWNGQNLYWTTKLHMLACPYTNGCLHLSRKLMVFVKDQFPKMISDFNKRKEYERNYLDKVLAIDIWIHKLFSKYICKMHYHGSCICAFSSSISGGLFTRNILYLSVILQSRELPPSPDEVDVSSSHSSSSSSDCVAYWHRTC